MGYLSSDPTDITIYCKKKPYVEKAQDDPCIFLEHPEYFNHDPYRRDVRAANEYQKTCKSHGLNE